MTSSARAAVAVAVGLAGLAGGPAGAATVEGALAAAAAAAGPGGRVPVILQLADAPRERTRAAVGGGRPAALAASLAAAHAAAAAEVRAGLQGLGLGAGEPLWIVDAIALDAPAERLAALADLPGVAALRLDAAVAAPSLPPPLGAGAPEWNVAAVRAPDLWALGHRGGGATVALLDTGVDAAHADLVARWRGGAADWFDPYGEHGAPYDPSGHGTGVAAIAVGGDAGGTAVGVAPGATWIAAKIFDDAGVGTLSGIHRAFQWALDPDGDPGTDDAPQVVNGSFGFPDLAGTCFREFEPDIALLRAAGIPVVFAAGNSGPGERTGVSPADNAGALAVGGVDEALAAAPTSSRGPSACDGGFFPRLAAPGVRVRTADLTAGGAAPASYASRSGTSFAAPHVAGILALLAAAWPDATVAQLEEALAGTALDVGEPGPDNATGTGVPDAVRAWRVLGGLPPCPDGDGDGFFPWPGCGTATDCDDLDPLVHPAAPEIARDGVDQDCNGYDLTIRVLRAEHVGERGLLRVRARSLLRRRAGLALEGYGPMSWRPRRRYWSIAVRGVGTDPGTVLVRGREGAVATPTAAR